MGLYSRLVLPRVVGAVCSSRTFEPWRRRVCEGLRGDVIEVGLGAGPNLAYFPTTARLVAAIEPDEVSRRRAKRANPDAMRAVSFLEPIGGRIDAPDGSYDAAVCTFTLCTVHDPLSILDELRRVVRPGGALHFLEHGLAPDAAVARWQRRLDPWEVRLAGGCHLTREPLELLSQSGWRVEWSEESYARARTPWSYFTVGVARAPR
jgi:ubiquinone/menaquinone biosynthesis C-methylase UbiE